MHGVVSKIKTPVIPAKAGIHNFLFFMDACFRRHDKTVQFTTFDIANSKTITNLNENFQNIPGIINTAFNNIFFFM